MEDTPKNLESDTEQSSEKKPLTVLCLDPGKTTGVAVLQINEKTPRIIFFDEEKDETLLSIEQLFVDCDIVVCEEFLVRPGKARQGAFDWQDMVAPRVIGSATTLAARYKKKFILQSPSIKPIGYGFANLKYVKGKKGQHINDAVAHGMYYLVRSGIGNPVSKKLI